MRRRPRRYCSIDKYTPCWSTGRMKQPLLVKLAPTPDQHAALLRTLETFNAACDAIADVAFAEHSANKIELALQAAQVPPIGGTSGQNRWSMAASCAATTASVLGPMSSPTTPVPCPTGCCGVRWGIPAQTSWAQQRLRRPSC
jgi:hypothetical protein